MAFMIRIHSLLQGEKTRRKSKQDLAAGKTQILEEEIAQHREYPRAKMYPNETERMKR
jgi:hypothetical protein